VLIQVIEAVLPTFETPLWVAQTITFLLILGFPIAILVGWASEKLPALSEDSANPSESLNPAHATSRRTLIWIGAASCVVMGLFGFYMMPFIFDEDAFKGSSSNFLDVGEGRRVVSSSRFQFKVENKGTRGSGVQSEISISPNGRYLVYTEFVVPNLTMYLHDFTSFDDPKILVQTALNGNTGFPQFSSDGQWIYYHQNLRLLRIRREGGTPQVVIDGGVQPLGIATSGVEVIYRGQEGLRSYNLSTEIDSVLTTLSGEELELDYSWPQFIPGTKLLIATKGSIGNFANASVDLINLETGEINSLAANGFYGKYLQSGHIVFVRDDSVWALPLNPETFEIVGDAAPVLFDAEINPGRALANYDSSLDGRFIYTSGNITGLNVGSHDLVSVDRNGEETSLGIETGRHWFPSRNPVHPTIATTVFDNDGESDIWLFDLQNKTLGRRTFSANSSRSIWSYDGSELIYACGVQSSICITAGDGTSSASTLLEGFQRPLPTDQASDGTLLITQGEPAQIYKINPNETANTENTLVNLNLGPSGTENEDGRLSPDEQWIAYSSDETGRSEIYVRPFPNISNGKWQVSREGGRYPRWDGLRNEISWMQREGNRVYSSSFQANERTDGTFVISFSNPQLLLSSDYRFTGTVASHDYFSETGEFYFLKNIEQVDAIESQIKLNIINDWFGELSDLVPAQVAD